VPSREGGTTQRQRAKTELGRQLLALRAKIVASGVPLLDWSGVEREVRERRGDGERSIDGE